MLQVKPSKRFKKSYKKLQKNKKVLLSLLKIIDVLMLGEKLDSKYQDHSLQGKYKMYRECHICPDFLLIYKVDNNRLILYLLDIGNHSNLF